MDNQQSLKVEVALSLLRSLRDTTSPELRTAAETVLLAFFTEKSNG